MVALFFVSCMLDILIMRERYGKIYAKKTFAEKQPIKVIVLEMFLIVGSLFSQDFFAIKIRETDKENIFVYGYIQVFKTQW